MVSGLMIMVSSSLPWINGSLPINASFGQMLSNTLSVISNGSISISIAPINQISMMAILFIIGVVVLVGAVLGSKPIGLIGSLFAFLAMIMWFIFANLSLDGIISHIGSLGSGTHLIMGGIIIALIAILLPQLHSKDG